MHFKIFNKHDKNYESVANHTKGFLEGLFFILVIVIVIVIFHFIGQWDDNSQINEETDLEYWNENIERSEGISDGGTREIDNPIYEQRRKDFGSKSLNEKDREAAENKKKEANKEAEKYLKQ